MAGAYVRAIRCPYHDLLCAVCGAGGCEAGHVKARGMPGGRRAWSAAAGAPGVVVDFEGLLGRALGFGDVLKVEADTGPAVAAPAHRVDEHVGGGQMRPDVRV